MRNRAVTHRAPTPDAFTALADPTRRAVLDLLRLHRRLPAGEIAGRFTMSRPAVSKHLRVLRKASLVRQCSEGRQRVYELNPAPLRQVDSWIGAYRGFWVNKLANLKDFLEGDFHVRQQSTNRRRRRHRRN